MNLEEGRRAGRAGCDGAGGPAHRAFRQHGVHLATTPAFCRVSPARWLEARNPAGRHQDQGRNLTSSDPRPDLLNGDVDRANRTSPSWVSRDQFVCRSLSVSKRNTWSFDKDPAKEGHADCKG